MRRSGPNRCAEAILRIGLVGNARYGGLAAVLAERRAAMGEIKPREAKGYLAMYRQAVQGMETGVILLPC